MLAPERAAKRPHVESSVSTNNYVNRIRIFIFIYIYKKEQSSI